MTNTPKKQSKKNVIPKLRFPEFEGQWIEKRLGEISLITMGQSPSSKYYSDNSKYTVLIQGNNDMKKGKVVPRIYTEKITKESFPNEIILTVRAPVGEIAINQYHACIGRGVCSIKANKFIYYLLEKIKISNSWNKYSQGSTFESINSSDVKNLKIKLSSIEEQNKIASFLSSIDKKIDLISSDIQVLKKFKKFLLQKLFLTQRNTKIEDDDNHELKLVPELRFPGFGGEWVEKKIKDLLQICYGKDYKSLNKGNIPVYGTGGIITYVDEYLYNTESVLIGRKGTINKPLYLNEEFWTVDTLFYTKVNKEFNVKFIYYLFCTINWLRLNEATGVPSLTSKNIENTSVKIPSSEEQNKIASFLSTIDKKIELMEKKHEQYIKSKEFLLQNLFPT